MNKKILIIIVLFFQSCLINEEENPLFTTKIYNGKYYDLIKECDNENLDKISEISRNNNLQLNHADLKNGLSLLNWCLLNKKIKSFERLLELGADPNWQDYYGKFAPPIIEASKLYTTRYLELCLKYKGNSNLFTSKGIGSENHNPLLGSIYPFNYMDNLKLLIKAGADVNQYLDTLQESLLADAIETRQMEKVMYLLENEADFNDLKIRRGGVIYDRSKSLILDSNDNPVIKYEEKINILEMLREINFELDSKEYILKVEIITFLKSKGLDYKKYPIPKFVREKYKDNVYYLENY